MSLSQDVINTIMVGHARTPRVERALARFQRFLHSQVIGALLLLACALVAMIWANSPWADSYFHLWETELALSIGETHFSLTLHQAINDALMMAFFLLIGLEVKEQILVGELSKPRQALLPISAALGGMLLPAAVYLLINGGQAGEAGWGVPMSTDIAFALGILALLGKRVPLSIKVFLAALAIADDIGAILVITLFYTNTILVEGLLFALVFWLIITVLSRLGIYNTLIYFTLSIGVWFGFFVSGVHPTIAGIVVAFSIPAHGLTEPRPVIDAIRRRIDPKRLEGLDVLRDEEQKETVYELTQRMNEVTPPLVLLSHGLQPWVTFIVMPLFALGNAGVAIHGNIGESISSPISIGIILGLIVGKPVGIVTMAWIAVKLGIAQLPKGVTWNQITGVGFLAGIGFTMSLFVTELAFKDAHVLADEAKLGIIFASLISGVIGYFYLSRNLHQQQETIILTDMTSATETA